MTPTLMTQALLAVDFVGHVFGIMVLYALWIILLRVNGMIGIIKQFLRTSCDYMDLKRSRAMNDMDEEEEEETHACCTCYYLHISNQDDPCRICTLAEGYPNWRKRE